MKKIILTLVLAAATVINVCAMSKYRASREARFLTDKMAWELDLSYGQMEDVYEINYDYFRALDNVYDKYSWAYDIRNEELSYVLSPRQWKRFIAIEYFYVPVRVYRHAWVFPVHNHYHTDHFYYDAPHAYSHYSGAHAHNRDFYRGRFDNHHKFDHDNGRRPHSSGNVYHNAPAPKPNGNHAPAPKPNKNQHNAVPNRGGKTRAMIQRLCATTQTEEVQTLVLKASVRTTDVRTTIHRHVLHAVRMHRTLAAEL